MKEVIGGDVQGTVAQQNLLEFLAVVTSPKRVQYSLPLQQALQKVAIYMATIPVIRPHRQTVHTLSQLLGKYPALGQRVFNLYLVATALDNGVHGVCTLNVKHLKAIAELDVATPDELLNVPQ